MNVEKPVALIFRTRLLPYSETFILNQANALRQYQPFFVGVRRVAGLDLPPESTWIANDGRDDPLRIGLLKEARFTLLGPGTGCRKALGKLRPQLIHAHFGPDGVEAVPLAAALNVPLIVTYHGYDATFSDRALAATRQGKRYLGGRAQLEKRVWKFVAVSHFIKSRLVQQGFPSERILVHYIGVDVARFEKAAAHGTSLRVLFTGRLTEKKGCAYLIQAMADVQKQLPEAELVVIGDGEQRKQLEEQAQATLRKYLFLGRQPSGVVKEWMQKSTLFCVPSMTAANGDAEGFGIVFAEAQACGLPVVSFASGGVPEAVAHSQTGLLAPERDWKQLAEYILLLLQRKDIWMQMSETGRHRVEREFNLKTQTRALEEVYMEARCQPR